MTAVIFNPAPWMRDAVCRGYKDVFFPEGKGQHLRHRTERAKRFCAVCPVRRECLELALAKEGNAAAGARYGVWGGCTPAERRRIWDERQRVAEQLAAAS
jgi:WhiB family redox-sensing transcriptional regulator